MKPIYTSSWATALPPTFRKIGISRAVPRGYPAGYRRLSEQGSGVEFFSETNGYETAPVASL